MQLCVMWQGDRHLCEEPDQALARSGTCASPSRCWLGSTRSTSAKCWSSSCSLTRPTPAPQSACACKQACSGGGIILLQAPNGLRARVQTFK